MLVREYQRKQRQQGPSMCLIKLVREILQQDHENHEGKECPNLVVVKTGSFTNIDNEWGVSHI